MQIITLYKYTRPDGGITVSPVKPDCEYTKKFRIVADEGKALKKGDIITSCIDTDSSEGWTEIDVESAEYAHEEVDVFVNTNETS